MKKYFFTSAFILLYSLFLVSSVQADTFEIHFRYNDQKDLLNFDERNGDPVQRNPNKDINQDLFEDSAKPGRFEYSFFDITGYEMERKQFDPQPGSFTIELPYYSIAKTLKVRRTGTEEYFLTKDISDLVSCNANQVCEYERGENFDTCIIDCANGSTQYSEETERLLGENDGVITDKETEEVLLRKEVAMSSIPITSTSDTTTPIASTTTDQSQHKIIILIITVLTLVGVGIVLYLWRRRRSA